MGVFIIVALVAVAFVVADAAASSGDAEDKIVGIIDIAGAILKQDGLSKI